VSPSVRVIRDPRDARRDYFLPKEEAHARYMRGELSLDMTNTKPGEPVYQDRRDGRGGVSPSLFCPIHSIRDKLDAIPPSVFTLYILPSTFYISPKTFYISTQPFRFQPRRSPLPRRFQPRRFEPTVTYETVLCGLFAPCSVD
jgi:hypothetical protein